MFDYQLFFQNMSDKDLAAATILRAMADHGYFGQNAVDVLNNSETKLAYIKDGDTYKLSLNLAGAFLIANFEVDYKKGEITFGGVTYKGGSSRVDTMDMLGYWLPKYMPEGEVAPNVKDWYQAIVANLN
ncbi:MAG: hypothetical protein LBM27_02860 [Lactobacillaceae bacterium]|jgi:hypothetical protein|nr:hypothetical protein [Lactobacillaceae bacterium]